MQHDQGAGALPAGSLVKKDVRGKGGGCRVSAAVSIKLLSGAIHLEEGITISPGDTEHGNSLSTALQLTQLESVRDSNPGLSRPSGTTLPP